MAPWILDLHQVLPDVVVTPVRDRGRTQALVKESWCQTSRVDWFLYFLMFAARTADSAERVPRTRMTSPLSWTTSSMNLFEGRIFGRSVHHRNLGRGARCPYRLG